MATVIRFSFLETLPLIPAHILSVSFIGILLSIVAFIVMRFQSFWAKLWSVFQLRGMAIVAIAVDLTYTILPSYIDVF